MTRGALRGLALVVVLTTFSGCFHDTFECGNGYEISNDRVNDGVGDCQGYWESGTAGTGIYTEGREDERHMGATSVIFALLGFILTFVFSSGGVLNIFNSRRGSKGRLGWGDFTTVLGYTVLFILAWMVLLRVSEVLLQVIFPVSHRGYLQIKSDHVAAVGNYGWEVHVLLAIVIMFGFSKYMEANAIEAEEVRKEVNHEKKMENAKRWRKRNIKQAEKNLRPLKNNGWLEPENARGMSAADYLSLQQWVTKYARLEYGGPDYGWAMANPSEYKVKIPDVKLARAALNEKIQAVKEQKRIEKIAKEKAEKKAAKEKAAREKALKIAREKAAKEKAAKEKAGHIARKKAAKEKAEKKAAKEKAARKKAAEKKAAKEKAEEIARKKAAKEKAEEKKREIAYFKARFGIAKTHLAKWEKEYSKDSLDETKDGRRDEVRGLEKAGVNSVLIDAYVDGMIGPGTLLNLKDIGDTVEPDEYLHLINMMVSWEHSRAKVAAGLGRKFRSGHGGNSSLRSGAPDRGRKDSWLNKNFDRQVRAWGDELIEIMTPGLSKEKESWKRMSRHLEALVRMSDGVDGIIPLIFALEPHQFKVIDGIFKKQMGEEERSLLLAFVEGQFTAEEVYEFVDNWGLTKEENLVYLRRILNEEHLMVVLHDAGLLQL